MIPYMKNYQVRFFTKDPDCTPDPSRIITNLCKSLIFLIPLAEKQLVADHKSSQSNIRVSFNKVNDDEEGEDFLCPRETSLDSQAVQVAIQDEDGYLKPKALVESEGEDEYLKPTFNQNFKRINSRDLSPPHEAPPAIPMQSYQPVPKPRTDYTNQKTDNPNTNTSYIPIPIIRENT